MALRDALDWMDGGVLFGDGGTRVSEVCTDTRAIRPGSLFVALRGERFDAHDFLGEARRAGAAAVVFERWVDGIQAPAIRVRDTRRALGEIARGWRRRFATALIAVTGSNGKTTVKEMLASILRTHFGDQAVLATAGNLNNEIGVPLTVLRLRATHLAAVVELGMNRPGEIAWLAEIAQPAVALVNNAQREHQEFLGSVEATARENGMAIAALADRGVAVFPGDDAHSPVWREIAGARRRLEFGLSVAPGSFAVRADPQAHPARFAIEVEGTPLEVSLAIAGRHNVRNALAATACAHALGVPPAAIARGLAEFRPAWGRLRSLVTAAGAALVDDAYNANPDSVRAAIDVLADMPVPRVLILGDMAEVGADGPAFHREVGSYAAARGVDALLALGDACVDACAAFGSGAAHFDSVDALLARAAAFDRPGASILVKGSRSMRMERVVEALVGTVAPGGH